MFPSIKDFLAFRKIHDPAKEIGIEIEMEGEHLNIKRNRMWQQKLDGSLRGMESLEYILSSPVEKKNVKSALTKLLTNLAFTNDQWNKAKLKPSDRCGVHIHINIQNMTFFEVFNFMFLYLMLERVLVAYCGESREGNLFCLRASDAEAFIDAMIDCKRISNLNMLQEGRGRLGLRYASMNPGAIFKFGSLEFRSLRTPENLLDIEEWVDILYQVKEASFLFDDPIKFVEHFSMRGEDRWFDDVMGNVAGILKRKVKRIDQKLMDGMRMAQDIAYTPTEEFPETLKDLGISPKKKKKLLRVNHVPEFVIPNDALLRAVRRPEED